MPRLRITTLLALLLLAAPQTQAHKRWILPTDFSLSDAPGTYRVVAEQQPMYFVAYRIPGETRQNNTSAPTARGGSKLTGRDRDDTCWKRPLRISVRR